MELLMYIRTCIALDLHAVARRRIYEDLSLPHSSVSLSLEATVNYNWQTQCAVRSLQQLVIHDNGIADV